LILVDSGMRRTFLLGAVLCSVSLLPAGTGDPGAKADYSRFEKKLSKDQQILHALDRLAFGPRPGDVAAVKKMGLKKWIDMQLHPEQIAENPELERRLQPLESLRMTQADTVAEYPPPQLIRAVAFGKQPMPEDPVARAAVERQVERFDTQRHVPDDQPMEPKLPLSELLTPEQIRILRTGSVDARRALLASLDPSMLDDFVIALPANLRNQLLPSASPELRRKLMLANNPQQVVAADLAEGKLFRAIYSNRQLEEVLTDFWYNHFNVDLNKGADRFLVPTYERDSIRPFVLGKFRDLLEATATSPAMLFYLDNSQSVAPQQPRPNAKNTKQALKQITKQTAKQNTRGLNENYARELMELHTLGVDGGYTQQDIIEVARCFTGWTIKAPNQGGGFTFNERTHDKGEKHVLGVTIPAGGGMEDGEMVLDILAAHPATSRHISRELAVRFVADDPPPLLVERMAKTFTDTDGDIRAVLETMIDSPEFFSQGAFKSKIKTPFEMIVSAVRASGARVDYAMPLANQLNTWGEPLYRKVEPTGYSNAGAEWVNSSALLDRMNFGMQLGQNRVQGLQIDPKKFSVSPAVTAREILFANASSQTLEAINKTLREQNKKNEQKKKNPKQAANPGLIAGLVIGSPDFQRR
jgi:uncharacterized protein (DUF1800 family)